VTVSDPRPYSLRPEYPAPSPELVANDIKSMSLKRPRASDLEEAESKGGTDSRSSKLCLSCASEEKKEEKKEENFFIIIAAHLANEKDWIGHSTVTLDVPTEDCKVASRITRGFWPRGGANFADPKLYSSGVPGAVLNDSAYYPGPEANHPLKAAKTFKITCAQAKAAMAVIRNREANPGLYSALRRQCTTFALDVLRAAGQNIDAGTPPRPGALYNTITGANLPAGTYSEPAKQLGEIGADYARQQAEQIRRRVEETMQKP
jgi:hypothetical protein